MSQNQKLELTWIGKDQRPQLEPRILLEDPKRSYYASTRVTGNDLFDNWLIKGDSQLALKALKVEFAGKVNSVFHFDLLTLFQLGTSSIWESIFGYAGDVLRNFETS